MARIGRIAGWLSVAIFAVTSSGCGSESAGCDSATRGCVQLVNPYVTALDYSVNGVFGGTLPGGSALDPGTAWVTVDPTVGAATTFAFAISSTVLSSTCTVKSSGWADPNVPPKVQSYWIGGNFRPPVCVNW